MCVCSCGSPLLRDLRALSGSRPVSRCSFCLSLHFFFFCCAVQPVGSQFPKEESSRGPWQCELAVLTAGWPWELPLALRILVSPGLFSPLLWLSFSSAFARPVSPPPSPVAPAHVRRLGRCLCGHCWLPRALLVQLSSCTSLLEGGPRAPACLGSPRECVLSLGAWPASSRPTLPLSQPRWPLACLKRCSCARPRPLHLQLRLLGHLPGWLFTCL